MAEAFTDTGGLTTADLEEFLGRADPDEGRRYELIGGSIVVNPSPGIGHQRGLGNLYHLLRQAAPPELEVFSGPLDVDLPGGSRVVPDLVVVERGRTGVRLLPPVALLVELVSPGNPGHDLVTKRALYEAEGVEHLWLVDARPGRRRFTALQLGAGERYETVLDTDGEVVVTEPVALRFTVDDLFRP